MDKEKDFIHKHDRVLEIYSRLLAGEVIQKQELAEEYGVSERSIQRDIDSIRDFYSNRASKGRGTAQIKYDRMAKGFCMVDYKTVTLTNAELFAVMKILLESRSLCKEEMEKIVLDLLDACLPPAEKRKMRELVQNELFHYVEPKHGKSLVHTLWELGTAVYSHHTVSMEYRKTNGEVTKAEVKPVGIMNSEFYMYLIAYIGDRDKEYPGYPTIYRIDRIQSYKVTGRNFRVPYRDRFEEGEFRKRIPFMYGGKLHKVSFTYTGPDIHAILDRLPTAKALKKEDGNYLVTAEVYGELGFDLWLNGQRNVIL